MLVYFANASIFKGVVYERENGQNWRMGHLSIFLPSLRCFYVRDKKCRFWAPNHSGKSRPLHDREFVTTADVVGIRGLLGCSNAQKVPPITWMFPCLIIGTDNLKYIEERATLLQKVIFGNPQNCKMCLYSLVNGLNSLQEPRTQPCLSRDGTKSKSLACVKWRQHHIRKILYPFNSLLIVIKAVCKTRQQFQ